MMSYGLGGMMGGLGILAGLMWIVILVDLILLGVYLWKKINNR